jgi:glycosyltransferase involved in cell wall biosynthesis
MNQPTVQLSAVIITYNEEACIERCIRSVKDVADEILVLDSFSTDRTAEICLALGIRFEQHVFDGYIEQKNRAWEMAKGNYVLSLDADEALSESLLLSIQEQKKKGFTAEAYTMNRMTSIGEKWIRHGSWYPDKKLRLAKKEQARWGGVNPHDKLILKNEVKTEHLNGDILHYSFKNMHAFRQQGERFSKIAAEAMHKNGKKSSFIKIYISPVVAFIKCYLIKRGFLDGKDGYQIAKEIARQTKMKYVKLRGLRG